MSGGSHGYIGRVSDMFELLEKVGHLEDVAQRLRELGHEAVANDTQTLYNRLMAEPECFGELRKVWHAVDYLDSNDYSEDQVTDAVREYQAAWDRFWCPCCIFGNHTEKCTCSGKGCCHPEHHAKEDAVEPIAEGTDVIYEGEVWTVIEHMDPRTHPKLSKISLSPQDFAAHYPDGVAYWIHPKDMKITMDNGHYSRVYVRRTSIEPVT
jgi:hypothetical protein